MKEVEQIKPPPGIDREDFILAVSAAYTAYVGNRGTTPDVDQICYYAPKLDGNLVSRLIGTDEFIKAMEARGVAWKRFGGLTARQIYFLHIVTDPTHKSKTLRGKLNAADVSYTEYRGWMKDPVFSGRFRELTEDLLLDHQGSMITKIVEKAEEGDLAAAKFALELGGRYDPNREQVINLQSVISVLLDIIQRNISDPVVLNNIAQEVSTVMQKTTLRIEK